MLTDFTSIINVDRSFHKILFCSFASFFADAELDDVRKDVFGVRVSVEMRDDLVPCVSFLFHRISLRLKQEAADRYDLPLPSMVTDTSWYAASFPACAGLQFHVMTTFLLRL